MLKLKIIEKFQALLWNNDNFNENKLKLGLTNFENNTGLVHEKVPEDGLFKFQITSIYSAKTFSRNSDKKLTCVFGYLNNGLTDSIDINLG